MFLTLCFNVQPEFLDVLLSYKKMNHVANSLIITDEE